MTEIKMSPEGKDFESCLRHLLEEQHLITGFTLFRNTLVLVERGEQPEDRLQVLEQLSSAFEGENAIRSVIMGGEKLIVLKSTLCSICAISERRRTGLLVGLFPAKLMLAAVFRRPVMPQRAMAEFERVCAQIRA